MTLICAVVVLCIVTEKFVVCCYTPDGAGGSSALWTVSIIQWVHDWHDNCTQVIKEEVHPRANKYTVRPPKDLTSKYEQKMEERRMKQLADEEQELRNAEAQRLRVCLSVACLLWQL